MFSSKLEIKLSRQIETMKEGNRASENRDLGSRTPKDKGFVKIVLIGARVAMATGAIAIPAFAFNPLGDIPPEPTPRSATVGLVTGEAVAANVTQETKAGEQEDPYIASAARLIDTYDTIFLSLNGGKPPKLDTQEEDVQSFVSDGTRYTLTVNKDGRRNLDIYTDGDREKWGYSIHPDQVLRQESTVEDTPFGPRILDPDPRIQPLVVITSSEIDALKKNLKKASSKYNKSKFNNRGLGKMGKFWIE